MSRTPIAIIAAVALLLAVTACKQEKKQPDGSAPPSATAASASGQAASSAAATGQNPTSPKAASSAAAATSGTAAGAIDAAKGASPAAYKHLPADCEVMARLDLNALLQQEAVKTLLVPQLDKALAKAPTSDSEKHLQAFLKQTGIKPLQDIHSLALCVREPLSSKPQFVALVGGRFANDTSIADALVANDDKFRRDKLDGSTVARAGDNNVVGQAADRVVLLANRLALFQAAFNSGSLADDKRLPLKPTLAAMVNGATVQQAARQSKNNPLQAHLLKVEQLQATVDASSSKAQLRFLMADKAAAAAFAKALDVAKREAAKVPGPLVDLQTAAVRHAAREVTVEVTLPKDRLRALLQLAMARVGAGR